MAEEEGSMYSGNLVCSKLCKAVFSGSRCLLVQNGAAGRSAKPALSLARSAAARNGKPTKTLLAAPLLAPLRLKVLEGGLKLKWRGRPKRQARPVSCSIRGRPKRQADDKTLPAAPLLAPLHLHFLEGGLKFWQARSRSNGGPGSEESFPIGNEKLDAQLNALEKVQCRCCRARATCVGKATSACKEGGQVNVRSYPPHCLLGCDRIPPTAF